MSLAEIDVRDSILKFHRSKGKDKLDEEDVNIQLPKSGRYSSRIGTGNRHILDESTSSIPDQYSLSTLSAEASAQPKSKHAKSVFNDISANNRDQKHYAFLLRTCNRIIFDDDTVSIGSAQMLFKDRNLQSEDLQVPQEEVSELLASQHSESNALFSAIR